MKRLRIEYDKTWKEIVTHLIEPFIDFFLPKLHIEIDWRFAPEFLEEELHNAMKIEKSKRLVDKLVKVRLKNGTEQWIFIHIEFQTNGSANIGKRMYDYYQLIRERYGKEIVALVIYTGENVPKKHNEYKQEYFGTVLFYGFHSYAVIKQTEAALLMNNNPFAIAVLANLYLLKTKDDPEKRYEYKQKIIEIARDRGYTIEYFLKLLIFVSELIKLPRLLEQKFEQEVILSKLKNNKNMGTVGKATKSLLNAFAKDVYGETVENLKKEKEKERKEKEFEKKAKIKVEATLNETIASTVVLLYKKVGMPLADIAAHFKISEEVVKQILISKGEIVK